MTKKERLMDVIFYYGLILEEFLRALLLGEEEYVERGTANG